MTATYICNFTVNFISARCCELMDSAEELNYSLMKCELKVNYLILVPELRFYTIFFIITYVVFNLHTCVFFTCTQKYKIVNFM